MTFQLRLISFFLFDFSLLRVYGINMIEEFKLIKVGLNIVEEIT